MSVNRIDNILYMVLYLHWVGSLSAMLCLHALMLYREIILFSVDAQSRDYSERRDKAGVNTLCLFSPRLKLTTLAKV